VDGSEYEMQMADVECAHMSYILVTSFVPREITQLYYFQICAKVLCRLLWPCRLNFYLHMQVVESIIVRGTYCSVCTVMQPRHMYITSAWSNGRAGPMLRYKLAQISLLSQVGSNPAYLLLLFYFSFLLCSTRWLCGSACTITYVFTLRIQQTFLHTYLIPFWIKI
jgi:hypothetical protein